MAPRRIDSRPTIVTFALLAGCGEEPGDVCDALADVGTGAVAFELLSDRPTLTVVAGPQGGHHFILHARMMGLDPGDPRSPGAAGNPRTRFAVFRDDVAIDLDQPDFRIGYMPSDDDGFHALTSGRIVQLEALALDGLDGQLVRVEVEIHDVTGECARDDAEVIAVVPMARR